MITALAALICAVPYQQSISYSNHELVMDTHWQARRNHTATVSANMRVNGKLVVNDQFTGPIMANYEHEIVIGTMHRPRTAHGVITIKSRDCTRSVRLHL